LDGADINTDRVGKLEELRARQKIPAAAIGAASAIRDGKQ
jgi:hypothetical protein